MPQAVASVYTIVLNWNRWRDTVACVDSLKRSTYPGQQIVVVDNKSTDDSAERIREAHPDITLICSEFNGGFASGNNLGIRFALERGAGYIWLLNNDTVVEEDTLARMVELAGSREDVGAVGSVLYYMDEPEKVQAWGGGRLYLWAGLVRHIYSRHAARRIDFLTAASILVRRAVFDQIGLLDERFFMYWEDVDFNLRLRQAGWKIAVAEEARVLHRENASLGRRSGAQNIYNQRSSILFLRKHSPVPPVSIAIGLFVRIVKRVVTGDWRRIGDLIRAAR